MERARQTIGNMIRTFKIQEMYLDNENPWVRILSFTMHTTTQHTPSNNMGIGKYNQRSMKYAPTRIYYQYICMYIRLIEKYLYNAG